MSWELAITGSTNVSLLVYFLFIYFWGEIHRECIVYLGNIIIYHIKIISLIVSSKPNVKSFVCVCTCTYMTIYKSSFVSSTRTNKTMYLLIQSFASLLHNINFTSDHLTAKLHFALFSMVESIQMCFIYVQMQLKLFWYILVQNLHTALLVFFAS